MGTTPGTLQEFCCSAPLGQLGPDHTNPHYMRVDEEFIHAWSYCNLYSYQVLRDSKFNEVYLAHINLQIVLPVCAENLWPRGVLTGSVCSHQVQVQGLSVIPHHHPLNIWTISQLRGLWMSCYSGDRVSQMGPLELSCWESWVKCWPLETHACIEASRMISGSLLCVCMCVFPASRFSCPATSNLPPSYAERILFIPSVGCLPHHLSPT